MAGERHRIRPKRFFFFRALTRAARALTDAPPLSFHPQPIGRTAIPSLAKTGDAPLTQSQRYKLVKWNGESKREKEGSIDLFFFASI